MQPEWKKVGVLSKFLTGAPAGKRPLGRPRRRWEDNIRMDIKEIGINTKNQVDLESPCQCDIEPLGSISHEFFLYIQQIINMLYTKFKL